MKALYVSDLDGTVLQDDGTLSPRAGRGLNALLEAGMPITFASARSVLSMRQILGSLPLTLPVIGANGAYLSDFSSGSHLQIAFMESDYAAALLDAAHQHGLEPMINSWIDGTNYFSYCGIANEGMQWSIDNLVSLQDTRLRRLGDCRVVFAEQIVSMTIIADPETAASLEASLKARGVCSGLVNYENTYSPGWHWVTVYAPGVTKGTGLQRLKEYAGLEHARTVVFGDNANDLELFAAADYRIAVGNAVSVLKDNADLVIGTNVCDSVVSYLESELQCGDDET